MSVILALSPILEPNCISVLITRPKRAKSWKTNVFAFTFHEFTFGEINFDRTLLQERQIRLYVRALAFHAIHVIFCGKRRKAHRRIWGSLDRKCLDTRDAESSQ